MSEHVSPPSGIQALLHARLAKALSASPRADTIVRRSDVTAPVPLSPAQRALWLRTHYAPAEIAYNVPFLLRFRGELDRAALLGVVRQLVERHELLRSVVILDAAGNPAMAVRPSPVVPVDEQTISADGLERALHHEVHRPFDLMADAPLRVVLFQLGPEHHVLAMTFHHIAVDAFARATVFKDLSACYNALVAGRPLPPAPPIQHGDYVASGLASALADKDDLAWWKEKLAGLPSAPDLPVTRTRGLPAWPAGHVDLDLGEALQERLRSLAAASGSTLFMVLLTGLKVLLAKACGSTDIVVGAPEAGRRRADTRHMLGCFVNTLTLRTDLAGDPTVTEALARVRGTALDAFTHATVPFERVVSALNPERDPRVAPVVQVLLNVYDEPTEVAGFDGVLVEPVEVPLAEAKFDLAWHVVDRGPLGLHTSLTYRADLFDHDTAERMATWFRNILGQLVAAPATPISGIVLEELTGPSVRGARLAEPAAESVHAEIEQWAIRSPRAKAVQAVDGSLSYHELDTWAEDLAHRLPDGKQPIGILLHPGIRLPVAILAVLKSGNHYVPLDPGHPPERLAAVLADAGIGTVLGEAETIPVLPSSVRAIDVGVAPEPGTARRSDHAPTTRTDLAYLVFTSGSTGKPKGVAVEHGHLLGYLRSVGHLLEGTLDEHPSFALVSTIAADLGLTNVFGALTSGGTLHLPPREVTVDPGAFARYLSENPVDAVKMVPSQLAMLAAHGDLAAVLPRRLLILAGEACPWQLIDRIRAVRTDLALHVHYGPTETTVSVLGGPVDDVPVDQRGSVAPLGRPMANVDCFVIGPDGTAVPAGVAGELLIGGPTVARGYAGRADLTGERFVPDPVTGTNRCYRTGDRVRLRPDGRIEFLGRLDDQVKIRGFRVELGEVLAKLRAAPGVDEAFVLALGQDTGPAELVAWVTGTTDLKAVRADLRRHLPPYMVPAKVVALDALPLTSNGKVDRAALPLPSATAPGREAPATKTERTIAAVWEELLGISGVGVLDDFFALGGDSFLALRAVRAIDPALRLVDLLHRPTVRSLADLLDEAPHESLDTPLLCPLSTPESGGMTLICLPYAGGTAAAYQPLAAALGPGVGVMAVQLPGHDPGTDGETLEPWESVTERLVDEVEASVNTPVAVYGHSAGAAFAVAVTAALEARGIPVTTVIVGAQLPVARENRDSDDEYLRALRDAGAVPEDMAEDLQRAIVRAARHDAAEARRWFSTDEPSKVAAPLLCVVGAEDPGTRDHHTGYSAWQRVAAKTGIEVLPAAGHFFLKHQASRLATVIETAVTPLART